MRFLNFVESYKCSRFVDALSFLNNNSFSRDEMNTESGNYKNIHYGDILIKFSTIVDSKIDFIPFINKTVNVSSKMNLLKDGDIVIADTAEDYSAGKAIEIIVGDDKVLSGLHTIPCRPRFSFSSGYLGYYLNSYPFRKQLLPLIQGIKVYSVSKYMFNSLFISYPSLEEQQKVSDFLLKIDQRINTQNNIIRVFESLIKSVTTKIYNGYKRKIKISNLVTFEKKTLHKSQDGLSNGMFPFYTNEEHQTKFYNSFDYDGLYILANTGGKANFKIVDGKFAVMSDTLVIRFNEPRLARTYIYYLQNNTKKINHDAFSGSGLKHLDKDAFLNMSVPLIDEHIDELNKLFELFENKLLLEKRILKVLLLQKQYLLNNMFI